MNYRVYLMDEHRHIRAAESFAADCNNEALEITAVLYDACSDTFPACELWQANTMIGRLPASSPQADGFAHDYLGLGRRQRDILELEELLRQSFACMRESRRLLRAMDDLKQLPQPPPNPRIASPLPQDHG